ncbi:hypothetical protein [Pantoea cypripedii]|uniref:Uncharacterized protein n=1 Tax=Pantoea cypripedii TaxID=55209 RepID=A0A6B9G4Z3_PANCY|nr:hypothetical protein [Pantoea cypripedii]QGY29377.1 hypothetical protein CUN67_10710 [Pantoea cypripedii]
MFNEDRCGLTAAEEAKITDMFATLANLTYKSRSNPSSPSTLRNARLLLDRGFSPQVVADSVGIAFSEVWQLTRKQVSTTWANMGMETRISYINDLWLSKLHPEQIRSRCDGLSYVSLRYFLHRAGCTDAEMLAYFPKEFADVCKLPTVKARHKIKRQRRIAKAMQ